ncbi:MAG: DUF362 domain-containing protein [Synergistaceae bacterium]|jgi:hypothetical protein|nr:DUF362 domain-containing protein [Synergistaceae bacterium]
MSAIDDLLEPVTVPKVLKVRQIFERPRLCDIEGEIIRGMTSRGALRNARPGHKVAVAAGSRGISNIPLILKTVVGCLKDAGCEPFLFPAMGSHGGATAEGQRRILEDMGVTEDYVGAPIKSGMETVVAGIAPNGREVYMDKMASEADAVVIVNRVKPHVSFRGGCESGLMKMIAIGMGKQHGADSAHRLGFGQMAENVRAYAKLVIANKNILCAVGIIENAFHETSEIHVMGPDEIERREPEMLKRAWALYPKLFFDKLDVLVLDEIGKDISGTGFDTNVVGRYHTPYASGGPDITRICALDITDKSHGNGNGLGILDFTTRRAYEKFDFEQSYPNSLTSTVPMSVKIPMVLKNDIQCVKAAIKTCNAPDISSVRLVRVKNTVKLDEIEVSEALSPYVNAHPNLETIEGPCPLPFDGGGNLF